MAKQKYDKRIARLCKGKPHPASHDSTWDEAFSELDAELYDEAIAKGFSIGFNDSTDFLTDALDQDQLGPYMTFDALYADFIKWLESFD